MWGNKNGYDIIFLDERMGQDRLLGTETARIIREREKNKITSDGFGPGWRGPSVIFACSGNASPEDSQLFLESGMDAIIVKPVPTPEVLRDLLVTELAKRGRL